MKTIQVHLIAAARPNFMKIAPLYHALLKEDWAEPLIVHTGQHYDLNMSDVFFQDLLLPEPHLHLGIGSGSHAEQTGRVMIAYENVIKKQRPALAIVVGDVNSTMACTLAAVKVGVMTAHLEAGLRSFDRTMPEEINRLVTDAVTDVLWTPSRDGDDNLRREGIPLDKIDRVGNIMIDSLEMMRSRIEGESTYKQLNLEARNYAVVTLHRPSNVDDPQTLKQLCRSLVRQSAKIPMVFPVHPRTRKCIEKANMNGDLSKAPNLKLLEPISYRRFINLVFNCRLAITDSGGIQEETTYLGIPCITLRPNTERPVTTEQGTNQLCRPDELEIKMNQVLAGPVRRRCSIELWDGRTAGRVVRSIRKHLNLANPTP
jgi:UDP-N-acetylglucosamine 2-epimerase (non-hydrolysing)